LIYALVTREQTHKFDGVLESLKQARISLQHKIFYLKATVQNLNNQL